MPRPLLPKRGWRREAEVFLPPHKVYLPDLAAGNEEVIREALAALRPLTRIVSATYLTPPP